MISKYLHGVRCIELPRKTALRYCTVVMTQGVFESTLLRRIDFIEIVIEN
jgi:hypothetical protein